MKCWMGWGKKLVVVVGRERPEPKFLNGTELEVSKSNGTEPERNWKFQKITERNRNGTKN